MPVRAVFTYSVADASERTLWTRTLRPLVQFWDRIHLVSSGHYGAWDPDWPTGVRRAARAFLQYQCDHHNYAIWASIARRRPEGASP